MANQNTTVRDEEKIKFALNPLQEAVSLEHITAVELGKKRTPRRILHFSDGTLEEYSTDEEEEEEEKLEKVNQPAVDPSTLPWSKWMLHHLGSAANNTLSAADFCGEKLAWFFGVTSPKYQYVLDEIQRRQLEEREAREREARDKEAERQQEDQTYQNMECAEADAFGGASHGTGYDNLVFSAEDNNMDLQKF